MKKEWCKPVIEILDISMTMKGFDPPKWRDKGSKWHGFPKDSIDEIIDLDS